MIARPPLTLRGLRPEAGDEDLVALGCRRTTFEWVMRKAILGSGRVKLVGGAKVEELSSPSNTRVPRVDGVRYRTNGRIRKIAADLVVDASGRNSQAVEWLGNIGARSPDEDLRPSGIVYYTRFYRMKRGVKEPRRSKHPAAGDFSWIKFAVFPADDRTFSITLAVPLAAPRLKVVAQTAAFDIMVRSIPGLRPWVAAKVATPIGDSARPVQAMGGLVNRRRRFVTKSGPVATGFFVLGDAAYCTNPLYGRGCAQAFLHADLLGQALDQHPGNLRAAAIELDRLAVESIEPFYRASVVADLEAVRKAEGRSPRLLADRLRARFFEDGVAIATRCDPVVFRAFVRMFNMLETPEQAFGRPEVVLRTLWVLARGSRYNERYRIPGIPDRDETIARCEAAIADGKKRKQRTTSGHASPARRSARREAHEATEVRRNG